MTTRLDPEPASPEFDRLMTGWFEAEARVRDPIDLLDRTTSRTHAIRPRPSWLLPERWIPMDLTMRRVRPPRYLRYAALVVVLAILAVVALVVVGSERRLSTPVPAPFGPARNGSIYFATTGGEIVGIDPQTSKSTVLVRGAESNAHPAISLSGTRIAFVGTDKAGHHVDVVDVRSSSTIQVSTKTMIETPHDFAWSPDDEDLAWISGGDLWLARTDGSGSRTLELRMTVTDVSWRPPAGGELLIRGAPNGPAALYLLKPDGSGLHPITPINGTENTYTEADWSPDGTRLAYSDVPPNIVHVLTIAGPRDRTVPPRVGAIGTLFPKWSPDGTRLAVLDWRDQGDGRVAIVRADDLGGAMVNTGPSFVQGPDYVWSPDGMQILAIGWNVSQPWILDPLGGEGHPTSWTLPGSQSNEGGENTLMNAWQRLAR